MNTKVETDSNSGLDVLKLIIALLILAAAVFGFYWYADQSLLYRVIGLLVAVGIAAFIAMQTETGRGYWSLFQNTQTEVKKVVWPTKQETTQMTLFVVVMVVLMAVFLWLLDMFLGWSIGSILGHGG